MKEGDRMYHNNSRRKKRYNGSDSDIPVGRGRGADKYQFSRYSDVYVDRRKRDVVDGNNSQYYSQYSKDNDEEESGKDGIQSSVRNDDDESVIPRKMKKEREKRNTELKHKSRNAIIDILDLG